MMDKKLWDELKEISKQEELLESVDPVNKKFVENSFKKHPVKIYKNGELPYEMSDRYLEGKDNK